MTRPRLYLHIGHPKTGTTSIQNYLRKQGRLLLEQGCLYPKAGLQKNGLPVHFRLFPTTYYYQVEENKAPMEMALLREEVARLNPKTVVVSCETAFGENTKYLKEAFAPFDVSILYYIRRQDLWIPSYYAQRIKYAKMPEYRPLKGMIPEWIPPYLKTLRRFADAFGRENVHVRPFEKNAWFNGDLIQDFLHQIGLDPAEFPLPDVTLNESLKSDYLRFLLTCNQLPLLRAEAGALRHAMAALSAEDPRKESGSMLDNETRRLILAQCAEENAAIAREFLGREDGVLFKDPFVEKPCSWSELDPLPPECQHAIFDRLPAAVRDSLSAVCPSIKNRQPGVAFLPFPCPDNQTQQIRTWCLREVGKFERQAAGFSGSVVNSLENLENLPELEFFNAIQSGLSRIRSKVLDQLAPFRPDLIASPAPSILTLTPECAALARACLLLPLWPAERQAFLQDLLRLTKENPGNKVAFDPAEERQPTPPAHVEIPESGRQHDLFSRLDPAVRQTLTFFSASIREALPGEDFWPAIPREAALWRQQVIQRDVHVLQRYFKALDEIPVSAGAGIQAPRGGLLHRLTRFLSARLQVNKPPFGIL